MPANDKSSITLPLCMAYSAPHITTLWLIAPVAIIQGVYAKYYGLSLTIIAAIVLTARLFDAISDPIIGYCVDRYHRRTGTRKPFMLVGGLLFILSSYFLYVPSDVGALEAQTQISPVYFAFWFIAFYLAWTLFEIPHIAWAGELALTSQDKTKIYSVRSISGNFGLLLFYAIPLLPFFETRDITPDTLQFSVIAAAILMLLFLYGCLKITPDSAHTVSTDRKNYQSTTSGSIQLTLKDVQKELRLLWQSLVGNKPFLLLISAFFFYSIGTGMWYSLIFIYVDTYLGMGDQFAQVFLLAFAVGIMATPVWYKLANILGKKSTWALAMVLLIISFIYTGTFVPGETSFNQLVSLKIVQTLGFSCIQVMGPAMLAETSDYGTWKYGTERTATYFAFYNFAYKTSAAIAAAVGLGIAGWYGFDAAATTHSTDSIFGLTLAIAWLPPVFACIALIFVLLSPINTCRHAIIRRRLDARAGAVVKLQPLCDAENDVANIDSFINPKNMLIPAKD